MNKRSDESIRKRAIEFFDEGFGYVAVANTLGLSHSTVRDWLFAYNALGKEALLVTVRQSYSFETKVAAVNDALDGKLSKPEILKKYGVSNMTSLRNWIKLYQEGGPDSLKSKKVGRKTNEQKRTEMTEEDRLRLRIEELELENEILKRIAALTEKKKQR